MHTEFVARRAVRILGVDYPPGAVIDDANIPTRVLSALTSTRRIAQRISNGDGTLAGNDVPIDPTGTRDLPHSMIQPGSGPSGLYAPETVIRSGYERLTFRPTGEEPRGPNRPPYEPDPAHDPLPPPIAPPGGPINDPVPNPQPDVPEPPSKAPEAPDEASGGDRGAEVDPLPWRRAWQAGVAVRPGFTGTFRAYLMARCASAGIITSGSVTDLLERMTNARIKPVPKVATMRPVGEGKSHGRPRKQRETNP